MFAVVRLVAMEKTEVAGKGGMLSSLGGGRVEERGSWGRLYLIAGGGAQLAHYFAQSSILDGRVGRVPCSRR